VSRVSGQSALILYSFSHFFGIFVLCLLLFIFEWSLNTVACACLTNVMQIQYLAVSAWHHVSFC